MIDFLRNLFKSKEAPEEYLKVRGTVVGTIPCPTFSFDTQDDENKEKVDGTKYFLKEDYNKLVRELQFMTYEKYDVIKLIDSIIEIYYNKKIDLNDFQFIFNKDEVIKENNELKKKIDLLQEKLRKIELQLPTSTDFVIDYGDETQLILPKMNMNKTGNEIL